LTTTAPKLGTLLKEVWLTIAPVFLGPCYIFREWRNWFSEVAKYHGNPSFRSCDRRLSRLGGGRRPPSWAFLDSGRTRQPYGETPLESYEWLLLHIPNAHNLKWIEPGCGRGRGVFWLATHLKPEQKIDRQVTGIDLSMRFFQLCRTVQIENKLDTCQFMLGDFCEVDYRPYDVVYLYATCTGDETLSELALRLLRLKPGSWVASITFPIEAYALEGTFEPFSERKVRMIWGETTLYVSRRTSHIEVGTSTEY
jgi:hypothetical protein